MRKLSLRWVMITLFLLVSSTGMALADEEEFLPPDEAFPFKTEQTDDGQVEIHWSVEPGYYLYRDRIEIEGKPADPESVDMPDGKEIEDQYFGKQEVYKKDFTIKVDPGDADKLELTWQGCAEKGLCYPPQHDTVDLDE